MVLSYVTRARSVVGKYLLLAYRGNVHPLTTAGGRRDSVCRRPVAML